MRLIDADKGLISKIQLKTGCNFITAQEIVDSMPTIEERKTGKWIIDDYEEMNHIIRVYRAHCSLCKKDPLNFVYGTEIWFTYKHKLPRLCPNCGAEMRGNDNE